LQAELAAALAPDVSTKEPADERELSSPGGGDVQPA
jgi:hypothetical protein